MGTLIDKVKVLRTTGRGSDLYGPCELCKKSASEMFVYETKNLFKRIDGSVYEGSIYGGSYGHRECLIKLFGQPNVER